jgi:hypothetical protein
MKLKLNKSDQEKPVQFIRGKYVSLKELKDTPVMTLAAPNEEDIKNIVLKRYEKEPPDTLINIVGRGQIPVTQIINEIKNDTELGKFIMNIEADWMKFLIEKMQRGEIEW